ncbi:hypothetical protein KSW81_003806 [Nannochloris sp. 'desiccata']|nr:hypothetical protein KSW81_003806 [Chlorella desiccata (nom. nud.)]
MAPRKNTISILDPTINAEVCIYCKDPSKPRPACDVGTAEYYTWRHHHTKCKDALLPNSHLGQGNQQQGPSTSAMPTSAQVQTEPGLQRPTPMEDDMYDNHHGDHGSMEDDMAADSPSASNDHEMQDAANAGGSEGSFEDDQTSFEDDLTLDMLPLTLDDFNDHRQPRINEARYFEMNHNEPLWHVDESATCQLTVLEASYLILVVAHEERFTEKATSIMLKLIGALLPSGHKLPKTYDVLRKSLGFKGLEPYERHVCSCGQHMYDSTERKQWNSHREDTCPKCKSPRFLALSGGGFKPSKRCYYFGVENTIKRLFSMADWVEARPSDYEEMKEDPGSFWSSPAAEEINRKTNYALFHPQNGAYSIGYDFVNLFGHQEYSVGLVHLRSESLPDEVRSKRRYDLPLMIIPGPNIPESLDAYMGLIAINFKKIGPLSGGPGILVTPMQYEQPLGTACTAQGSPAAATVADNVEVNDDIDALRPQKAGTPFYHIPILVFIYADAPARAKLLKSTGTAAAYLACFWCWLTGERVNIEGELDISNGTMVMRGYAKHVEPSCGFVFGKITQRDGSVKVAEPLSMDDRRRMVTEEHQSQREAAAEELISERNKEPAANLGCMGKCIILPHLPYLNARNLFVLPLYHMLYLGVVKDFLKLAMGHKETKLRKESMEISNEAKRKIAEIEGRIQLTGDFGRPIQPLSVHRGWLIEHVSTFVDCTSKVLFNDVVVGVEVLPPEMKKGWKLLRKALLHYFRPHLNPDTCHSAIAREAAAKALFDYGAWAENIGLSRQICKFNLHTACCRLPRQEEEMGQPIRYNEMHVENNMTSGKSKTRGHTTSEYPELTIAEGYAINHVLQKKLVSNPTLASVQKEAFKKIRRNKNVDEGATRDENDVAMLFTGVEPSMDDWGKEILVAIKRLAAVDGWLPENWKKEWLNGADNDRFEALKPMVYTSAVIHSVSIISSVENKRERTRSSCFVQVRFVKATGEEHCRPACILKMPSEEKYYLLFASVDLCQLRLLTLEGASVLGHANEAIADSTLSVPITSPATKRAHWKLLGTEILNLPKQLKSKVGSNYKKIKRRIPPANMFSTFLRYSRNPKDYKNGTQVGGRTVNGEPVKQQTACSSAIASREVHNVIMQAMKPITLLQRDFLAANNPTTTSVVVNWMNMNAKAITTGGWGVLPHLDGMDSGGVAYIIQYGLGDLRELHGGHMCLPQLHLICPVGACTVHFLRTGSLLHNSLPHVASEKARVVGTSLHVNKSFLIMSNAQSRMQGLDGEGYVQYAQESCIDSETLKDCTEMKKLLKFGNWRV